MGPIVHYWMVGQGRDTLQRKNARDHGKTWLIVYLDIGLLFTTGLLDGGKGDTLLKKACQSYSV